MSKRMVNQLTRNDNKNPSGFQLKKLADQTNNSEKDTSVILTLLKTKLGNSSPNVKFKALRCMKYVAQHGRNSFRQGLARDKDDVDRAQRFQGEQDPMHGDHANERVRNEAKELMEILRTAAQADSGGYQNTYSIPADRREGVTNAPTDEKKKTGWFKKRWGKSAATQEDGDADSKPSFEANNFNKNKPKYDPNFNNFMASGNAQASWEGKRRAKKSVGGGWGDDDGGEITLNTSQTPNYSVGAAPSSIQAQPITTNYAAQPAPKSDGEFERRLIAGYTVASGVRAMVARKELNDWVKKCQALDLKLMAELLDANLEDDNKIVATKTLCLINALLTQQKYSCDDFEDYFVDNPEGITALCSRSGSQGSLAKKIMRTLDPSNPIGQGAAKKPSRAKARAAKTQPATSAPAPALDIFGNPEAAPAPAPSSGGGDMFGGMSSGDAPAADFGFGDNTAAPSVADTGNMFGDMNLNATPEVHATTLGEAQQETNLEAAMEDTLNILDTQGEGSLVSAFEVSDPAPSSGGALDFMNGGGSSAPAPKPTSSLDSMFGSMGNSGSSNNNSGGGGMNNMFGGNTGSSGMGMGNNMNMGGGMNNMGMQQNNMGMNNMGMQQQRGMGMGGMNNMGMQQQRGMNRGMMNNQMGGQMNRGMNNQMGMNRGMNMQQGMNRGMGMQQQRGMGMGMQQQQRGMGMGMQQQHRGMGMQQQQRGMGMGMGMGNPQRGRTNSNDMFSGVDVASPKPKKPSGPDPFAHFSGF